MNPEKHFAEHQARINRFKDDYARRRDRMLDQIKKAFSHTTREGGITLHEAGVIDDYGGDNARRIARTLDTDTHWSEVDPIATDPGGSCLSFLDDIGFRYYLPAYMRATLRHAYREICDNWIDSNIFESTIQSLNPPADADHTKYQLFDLAQSRCVARFLVLDMELDSFCSIDDWVVDTANYKAIDRYWKKFISPTELKQLHQLWPKAF